MNWIRNAWENMTGECPIESEIAEAVAYAREVANDSQAGDRLHAMAQDTIDQAVRVWDAIENGTPRQVAFAAFSLGRAYESMRVYDFGLGGWMSSKEVSEFLELDPGRVSHLVNSERRFRTNGKTRKAMRINARDVYAYRRRQIERDLDEHDEI